MLARHVCVTDPDGQLVQFGPGDEVPRWARGLITNPRAWAEPPEPVPEPRHAKPRARAVKGRKAAEVEPEAGDGAGNDG